MPQPTREEELALGLTAAPAGQAPMDPKTKIKRLPVDSNVFRRRINLSEEDLKRVKETLDKAITEWENDSSFLRSKLQRIIELTSGVKRTKNFPWRDSSNIHVPLIETHIGILWSSVEGTMLKSDPVYTVRTQVPDLTPDESVDPNIENFLSYKVRNELGLDRKMSEAVYNAFRDPLAIAAEDWIEEKAKRHDMRIFEDLETFQREYPSPAEAGVPLATYEKIIETLLRGEPLHLRVEEEYVKYRGPDLRVIELSNLVVWPSTSPSFEYAQFVGDYFLQRSAFFKKGIKYDWFDKEETEKMLETKQTAPNVNRVTQAQDRIEGLARNTNNPDEYRGVQGILKIDLDNDGEEEMYPVIYNPTTKNLIRIEMFPYWHNRMNYIEFRVKKKTGRLLGECVYDWLFDLNEEVDTQHNQPLDSRTITTVPSFKKKNTSQFDPTRADQKFYPGVTFKVATMDEVQQFEIKQTDVSSSMQEETWLFQIAEFRDGASLSRSGRESARDPRASGKKTLALLAQSSERIDPYIQELKSSIVEVGTQMLELYYQFSPETILYPHFNQITGQWLRGEIARSKLRSRNMTIDIARSSIDDNPDITTQRRLVEYNILIRNPLIANNIKRLHALTRELVLSMRKKNANDLVPPLEQFIQEMQQQAGLAGPGQPINIQAMMQNILNSGQGNGSEPTGSRQGGSDVSIASVGRSPSP